MEYHLENPKYHSFHNCKLVSVADCCQMSFSYEIVTSKTDSVFELSLLE